MDVRHPKERVVAPGIPIRASTAEILADVLGGLAIGLESDERALLHEIPLHRLHAVVVVADRSDTAIGLGGPDVEVLGAVFELSDIGELHEARAGIVRLVPDDAVDLGRMSHDLVKLTDI